jgi:chaperonin GroES
MKRDINTSGIQPVEYKVLILPDEIEERTAGGLFLPDNVREKEELAQVKGILIEKGGNAFEDWGKPVPDIGDRVYVAKYAGIRVEGVDGKMYQLANDKDIAGIITKDKQEE